LEAYSAQCVSSFIVFVILVLPFDAFHHFMPSSSLADELYPIALLIDELKNSDHEVRTKAMKRIQNIASTLGPQRTRDELIPYLNGNLDKVFQQPFWMLLD
jgi:hypothetical protein